MRKTVVAVAGAALLAGGLAMAGTPAEATDCSPGPTNPNTGCTTTVTAVVGGVAGVRTLGAVAPVTLVGTSAMTGALAVPVVETAVAGAPWSVTAQSSALSDGSGHSIAASNLTVADTTLPTSVGCLSTALLANQQCTITGGGAARALDTSKTLYSVAGESASTLYSGTYNYAGLLSLAVPNGTPAGTYSGQLTVTLVQ